MKRPSPDWLDIAIGENNVAQNMRRVRVRHLHGSLPPLKSLTDVLDQREPGAFAYAVRARGIDFFKDVVDCKKLFAAFT